MTKLKRPQLKVIFAGAHELATLLEDIGHLMAGPILPSQVVDTVRIALTA
jgi:hypothetical protein